MLVIEIQIFPSKSACMKVAVLLSIIGSIFGKVFVMIWLLLGSKYPIWFLGVSVNQIFPSLSFVSNIEVNPSNEYDVKFCDSIENSHNLGEDGSLIQIESFPSYSG